jgi:hypothetical protein
VTAAQAKRDAALIALYAAEEEHKRIRGASTDEQRKRLGDVRAAYWVAERELSRAKEEK